MELVHALLISTEQTMLVDNVLQVQLSMVLRTHAFAPILKFLILQPIDATLPLFNVVPTRLYLEIDVSVLQALFSMDLLVDSAQLAQGLTKLLIHAFVKMASLSTHPPTLV